MLGDSLSLNSHIIPGAKNMDTNSTCCRTLGRSGIQVSAVGLGCWAIGGQFYNTEGQPLGWGEVDDGQSIRAIHCALDWGVNFFDTADAYGVGHSEEVLGRALKGRRDKVVIATKFGNLLDTTRQVLAGTDARPEYIRQALEASLKRLDTDYVDLYQFHIWGYPPEEALPVRECLEDLVMEGKIRGYAWSTDVLESVEMFARGPGCTAVQNELNLFRCDDAMLRLCERENLASVNRSPLAMGVLTGKYGLDTSFAQTDVRSHVPWYLWFKDGKPSADCLHMLDAIRDILTSGRRTLAQGALAWIWARSERTIPIPGFKNAQQAEENARAMAFGPLTQKQINEIDSLLGRL
jgi:aryl-alcohol dehydrogenase-like predicted oxidoreductase